MTKDFPKFPRSENQPKSPKKMQFLRYFYLEFTTISQTSKNILDFRGLFWMCGSCLLCGGYVVIVWPVCGMKIHIKLL